MTLKRFSLLSVVWIPILMAMCASCSKRETTELPFQEIQLATDFAIRDIIYQTPEKSIAVGGQQFKNGFIAASDDDWRHSAITEFGGDVLNGVQCDKNENCIAAGFYSKLILNPKGGVWFPKFLPEKIRLSDVCDLGRGTFLLVGGHSLDFGILQRVDSTGLVLETDSTWLHEFECAVRSSRDRIHVGGYGIIMHSRTAGNEWIINDLQGDFYMNMNFPSEQIGYAVGEFGTILRTGNSGDSWEVLLNGNSVINKSVRLKDVAFENDEKGVVVGSNGLVWTTSDSGDNWKEVANLPRIDYHCITYYAGQYVLGGEGGKLVKMTF